MKLNKKRNTYFLHRIIVEEIATKSLNKEPVVELSKIHRQFFDPKTELGKELAILREFHESTTSGYDESFRFLLEMKNRYSKRKTSDVFSQQTELIKSINNTDSKIFSNFLKEYRIINNLDGFLKNKLGIKAKIEVENALIKTLMSEKLESPKRIETKDVLVSRKFRKAFNEKYKEINEDKGWVLRSLVKSKTLSERSLFFADLCKKTIGLAEELSEAENTASRSILSEAVEYLKSGVVYTPESLQKVINIFENFVDFKNEA